MRGTKASTMKDMKAMKFFFMGFMLFMVTAFAMVAATADSLLADLRAQDQQQAPVFRARTSAVRVEVGVRDAQRRMVEGLTAADFTVLDNGVAQQVDDVTFGKVPIDVTVALDVSRSVAGPLLDRLRQGVMQLARDLRKEDRLRLLIFNFETQRLVDFTGDIDAINRAMNAATASGGTALFDALSLGLISANDPDRRQLIVVFTDGQDGHSTTSPEAMNAIAERSRATVSLVVLPTAPVVVGPSPIQARSIYTMPGPGTVQIHPALQKLATDTGGQVLPATNAVSLGPYFLRALELFRATYVLHYTPRGVEPDGFHTLSVQVNKPGAVVQARRGYFAGK